jgi:soluble lytic murein transglycosylase-like protein
MLSLRTASFLLLVAAVLSPGLARADIYSYIDAAGVVHFTNMPRPGKKWKRIMKTGPGKAAAGRGSSVDKIPPRDRDPERYRRYDAFIRDASTLYHIPISLIRAVIQVESDYDPRVVSRAGAQGLMQLMPATSRGMGVTEVFDPRQNIFGGTRFLRILANAFAGDLVLTISAYHAGPFAVKRYRGIPPYQTTQKYVRWVLSRYYRQQQLALREASSPPIGKTASAVP